MGSNSLQIDNFEDLHVSWNVFWCDSSQVDNFNNVDRTDFLFFDISSICNGRFHFRCFQSSVLGFDFDRIGIGRVNGRSNYRSRIRAVVNSCGTWGCCSWDADRIGGSRCASGRGFTSGTGSTHSGRGFDSSSSNRNSCSGSLNSSWNIDRENFDWNDVVGDVVGSNSLQIDNFEDLHVSWNVFWCDSSQVDNFNNVDRTDFLFLDIGSIRNGRFHVRCFQSSVLGFDFNSISIGSVYSGSNNRSRIRSVVDQRRNFNWRDFGRSWCYNYWNSNRLYNRFGFHFSDGFRFGGFHFGYGGAFLGVAGVSNGFLNSRSRDSGLQTPRILAEDSGRSVSGRVSRHVRIFLKVSKGLLIDSRNCWGLGGSGIRTRGRGGSSSWIFFINFSRDLNWRFWGLWGSGIRTRGRGGSSSWIFFINLSWDLNLWSLWGYGIKIRIGGRGRCNFTFSWDLNRNVYWNNWGLGERLVFFSWLIIFGIIRLAAGWDLNFFDFVLGWYVLYFGWRFFVMHSGKIDGLDFDFRRFFVCYLNWIIDFWFGRKIDGRMDFSFRWFVLNGSLS